jgi:hypothetical protein
VQGVKNRTEARGTIDLKQVQDWDERRMNTILHFRPSESRQYRGKTDVPAQRTSE